MKVNEKAKRSRPAVRRREKAKFRLIYSGKDMADAVYTYQKKVLHRR